MSISRLRAKGQLTIPDEIRRAAHLEEGDPIEIEVTPDGILLRPQKVVDATQAWFWTPAWQAGEREASADLEAGRTERYETARNLITSLRERTKP